ncbi:hypothetical protein HR060_13550 [Catenovulum sp. SM1970]|uniref:hypothetical protein n=1 Tax=Marinifaba aquimaris TaxID=2741323 RepID=UPI001572978D|nr:hypothetical protein [Marinifaba aquimaris]NTS77879.1 hypothetical protein [Marinifaba aquimaris]
MRFLASEQHDEINNLFIQAFNKLDEGNTVKAQKIAEHAWSLLPEPKYDWDVTLSLVSDICEMYRELSLFESSHKIVDELISSGHLKEYQDGPLFLKGTIYFEQGKTDEAKQWFDKANTISKGRCFVGEPKKYKAFFDEYTK